MNIKTNRHWHEFVTAFDIPPNVLLEQFDYHFRSVEFGLLDHFRATLEREGERGFYDELGRLIEESSFPFDGFFCYRGVWYSLDQFERRDLDGWDGARCDSFFSGVLIKVDSDGERYQVGTFYC